MVTYLSSFCNKRARPYFLELHIKVVFAAGSEIDRGLFDNSKKNSIVLLLIKMYLEYKFFVFMENVLLPSYQLFNFQSGCKVSAHITQIHMGVTKMLHTWPGTNYIAFVKEKR